MRITNNMMVSKVMRNLNNNMLRLDKLQTQGSTTKRINRPSDDPIAIARSLRVKSDISQLAQYGKNVDDAISWLETTELAVKQMNEAIVRVRDLMVQAANGPLTVEETTKVQEEIKELKAQIISLGNSSYGNSYIFSGKKIDQPLFDKDGNYLVNLKDYVNPAYVDDKKNIQIGNFENIGINTLGFELFEAFSKPVVYSGNLEEFEVDPITNTYQVELTMENGKSVTVDITIDTSLTEDYTINEFDGTTGKVTVQSSEKGDHIEAIINTLEKMGETYGSPLTGYSFSGFEGYELKSGIIEKTLEIKATPPGDATAVDKKQIAAVWETGAITPTTEGTFTFMGVTINIINGTATGDNTFIIDGDVTKNSATVVVEGDITEPEYLEAISKGIVQALKSISEETGSKIAGFTFQVNDNDDGIIIMAPENSGPLYNKEAIGGTIAIENSNPTDQLKAVGHSESKTVVAGQKAGLIQMLDKLSDELLRGNNEEISELLGQIDAFHQNLLKVNSEIGAKVNRMDLVSNRVADETINFKKLLSQLEDADMAQVYMDIIREENIYRSSLSMGARIIQPTLLDFLR